MGARLGRLAVAQVGRIYRESKLLTVSIYLYDEPEIEEVCTYHVYQVC
jgi:hypothetical protein